MFPVIHFPKIRLGHQDRPDDLLSGSTTDDENLESQDAEDAEVASAAQGSASDAGVEGQEQGAASESESSAADQEQRSCRSRSRSRSASQLQRRGAASRSRSRKPIRRRQQLCWFGRSCRRKDCYFLHPEGKDCQAPQTPRRRRFPPGGPRGWRRSNAQRHQRDQRDQSETLATPPKHCKRSEENTKPPSGPLKFRDFVLQMPEGTPPDVALEAFQKYLREASQKDLE
eukprot:s6415_g1.t1